ncbi:MAG: response regulator transcription factor [Desulfosalsimonas sp.]|uniref:response regulator transcription factor n=1 Tax=Desulfosalsimonas sp. TaxID=3073848 RepID=UPI003970C08B
MNKHQEKKRVTIFIVDDHPVFCLGMTELINKEKDLQVIGSEENAQIAIQEIENQKPDFVIVDISLKDSDGIDLVQELNRSYQDLPVLVLSMYDESLYAERAMLAGARGYIMKQEAIPVVVKAIRHVLAGNIYASEKIKEKVFQRLVTKKKKLENNFSLDLLSNRELEVFRLTGKGFSTKEIAEQMNLSPKTIGTYRENIKNKLDLKHYTELIKFAVHWSQKIEF